MNNDKELNDAINAAGEFSNWQSDLRLLKLFPELDEPGPMRRLTLFIDGGDLAFSIQRAPNGTWAGVATSAYDSPERMDHLKCLGTLKYFLNEGLVEGTPHG
jgi:hypothetical protein